MQVTLAEDFSVGKPGAIYESAGCLRDVVENHLFQVVALPAMEPPAFQSFDAVHNAKGSVLQAMLPLAPADLVRGQYVGYRDEQGVGFLSICHFFTFNCQCRSLAIPFSSLKRSVGNKGDADLAQRAVDQGLAEIKIKQHSLCKSGF